MRKINQLIQEWPQGTVATLAILKEKAIGRDLIKRYKKSGWIEAIGRGAYKLAGDKVGWEGGIYALQQSGQSIRIGARTALELKGFGHYVTPGLRTLYLFSPGNDFLPQWFKGYDWSVSIVHIATNAFPVESSAFQSEYQYKDFSIRISGPELACLEMMYHIPGKQSFDEAMQIMAGLSTLRPNVLMSLLLQSSSIKVKRLFLYMAEKNNHRWFSALDLNKIDIGAGKRVIIKNGILDKKYLITVPRESQA
jgi:hypothetical protein